jgi:perosamine synthetase
MIQQYEPRVKTVYAEAVYRQIMTGMIGSGQTVIKFEERIMEITGARYAVSTTSGTSALLLALLGLRLRPASLVLFPAYTFLAGANAAKFLGYNVRLVDVDEETLSMDPHCLAHVIANGPADAVMFVNHNGYVGPALQRVKAACSAAHLPLIEDSSQALGMPQAGRVGIAGIFSFSVPKLVTSGQGGVLITDNPDVATVAKQFRDHGDNWRKDRIHAHLGINLKYNDILASYVLAQLDEFNLLLRDRQQLFDWYRKRITVVDFGMPSALFVIYRSPKASAVIEALSTRGYQAVQYYKPVNWNVYYSDKTQSFPIAEKLYRELVYLPSSLTLTEQQIDEITSIVHETEGTS